MNMFNLLKVFLNKCLKNKSLDYLNKHHLNLATDDDFSNLQAPKCLGI